MFHNEMQEVMDGVGVECEKKHELEEKVILLTNNKDFKQEFDQFRLHHEQRK